MFEYITIMTQLKVKVSIKTSWMRCISCSFGANGGRARTCTLAKLFVISINSVHIYSLIHTVARLASFKDCIEVSEGSPNFHYNCLFVSPILWIFGIYLLSSFCIRSTLSYNRLMHFPLSIKLWNSQFGECTQCTANIAWYRLVNCFSHLHIHTWIEMIVFSSLVLFCFRYFFSLLYLQFLSQWLCCRRIQRQFTSLFTCFSVLLLPEPMPLQL